MDTKIPWLIRIEVEIRAGRFLHPEEAIKVIDYMNRALDIFKCLDPDKEGNSELCRDHKRQMLKLIRDLDME